jgi:hypothetical protein
MFLRRRKVPHTPPSFVKLRRCASLLITGSVVSVPNNDQVPELTKAPAPLKGMAATADPVS